MTVRDKPDPARRVAEAMKPAVERIKRVIPEEPPPEDPLMDIADAEEVGDNLSVWTLDPMTRAQLKKLRVTYLQKANQLFALALASTDPRVAALGGQINGLRLGMAHLGHKEQKS